MSENSLSAPLPASPTGVGLGYGIAIAVGILLLISTIMLASYLCVRIKGPSTGPTTSGPRINRVPSFAAPPRSSSPPATVPLGLDPLAIEYYYPKYPFSRHAAARLPMRDADLCAICLGDYDDGEMVRVVPECAHCFHAGCVDEWLQVSATCPVCRSSPVLSAATTPAATPLSELIPLAFHAR